MPHLVRTRVDLYTIYFILTSSALAWISVVAPDLMFDPVDLALHWACDGEAEAEEAEEEEEAEAEERFNPLTEKTLKKDPREPNAASTSYGHSLSKLTK